MKPRKQIKPHDFVEKEWVANWTTEYRTYTQEELISRVSEVSTQIHQNTLREGSANFMILGSDAARLVDEAMRSDLMNDVSFGDGTVSEDGTTLTQEVTVVPNRPIEEISVTINTDSWSGITF